MNTPNEVLGRMTLPQARISLELLESMNLPKVPYSFDILKATADRVTTLETTPAKLIIEYDAGAESPCTAWDDWKVVDFNLRHRFSEPVDHYFPASIGLRSKLRAGLAFNLSYSEHGSCAWHIDTDIAAQPDGLITWDHGPSAIGAKSYEDRRKDAERFLESYTHWCNGEVYCYEIQNGEGHRLEGGGLFYGYESLVEHLQSEHPELWDNDRAGRPIKAGITIEGNAKGVLD